MKEEKLISTMPHTRLTMLLNLITKSKMRLHSHTPRKIKPQKFTKNCNLVHIELGPNFNNKSFKENPNKVLLHISHFFSFFQVGVEKSDPTTDWEKLVHVGGQNRTY
jgi:hypothetical protein